jgi:hypothetical protein
MAHLCQGRIVWTPVADRNRRNRYPRPVIILTPDEQIGQAKELFGVVASNTAAVINPRPPHCIDLPFHPSGRVGTKLRKPTVAVCNWVVAVDRAEIEDMGGIVSPKLVSLILEERQRIDWSSGESADEDARETNEKDQTDV